MSENDESKSVGYRRSLARRKRTWLVLPILIALVLGAGFFSGRSTGEDLDAAHDQGAAVGQARGVRSGTANGMAEGATVTFADAYGLSYRLAYRKAFRAQGADPPKRITVKVPEK